jgi:predicted PurR-regulated permease PerM
MVLSLLVLLLIPTIVGVRASYHHAVDAAALLQQSARDADRREDLIHRAARLLQIDPDALNAQIIQAVRDGEQILFRQAMQAVGNLFSFGLGLTLFLLSTFFFLKDGQTILETWEELTPLDLEQDRKLRRRFAVAVGAWCSRPSWPLSHKRWRSGSAWCRSTWPSGWAWGRGSRRWCC